ncbi:DUF1847 domain-containing protein [candidate division CSSED10-310 bacterium]|uniref:DUF1847 domain-containing protein n=1 Tax=candidate division CSSED10-310 bacterium TaxID=2855610 RepID=A0ABV6Z112_UNCC1
MKKEFANCAQCPSKIADRLCKKEDGEFPLFCPTNNKRELMAECLEEYDDSQVMAFAKQASIQEGEGYENREVGYEFLKPVKPRILEIAEFAQKMNFKRLGLAFCVGLRQEAKIVGKFFESKDFEVISVICKVGRVPKEHIGLHEHQKIAIGSFETMCNPILQTFILNDAKTEFNILLGLCVGHDSLFFKYSAAPCTVLAVKDRVLGHNPLAAIYTIDSYYRSLRT